MRAARANDFCDSAGTSWLASAMGAYGNAAAAARLYTSCANGLANRGSTGAGSICRVLASFRGFHH